MRLGLALACSLAMVACAANSEAPPPDMLSDERADPFAFNLSVAKTLLETQQPYEASRVARRLIAMDKKAVEPYYLLARAYVDLRQLAPAEKMLREALRLSPEHARALSLYGTLLDMRGEHVAAAKKHRKAIELDGENAGFRNNLGFSLYLSKNYGGAIAAYKRALERDAGSKRIHNNLGFAYGKLGDMAKAAEHFATGGRPAQVSNNLGVLHEERGELEAAYQYFLSAALIDSALVPARANLERVCTALGKPFPELPDPEAQLRASVEPVDAEMYIDAEPHLPSTAAPAPVLPVHPAEVKP